MTTLLERETGAETTIDLRPWEAHNASGMDVILAGEVVGVVSRHRGVPGCRGTVGGRCVYAGPMPLTAIAAVLAAHRRGTAA